MPLTVPGGDFAPSVTQQPLSTPRMAAPNVVPGQNFAPQLIDKLGSDAMQAGAQLRQVGSSIGDAVRDMTDTAQLKSAENQFLQAALPVLSKYKTTQGLDATNQYGDAAQAIAQARADAAATLTSPYQQHAFGMLADAHLTTLQAQMAAHRDTEQVQYGKDQSKQRGQNLNATAALDVAGRNRPDSVFAQYAANSDLETLHYAQLSGQLPDDPQVRADLLAGKPTPYAQAEAALRLNRSDRYETVVRSLLASHAVNEAEDFYNEHKGEMDQTRARGLGDYVKSASQADQVTTYANQAVQSLNKVKGPGPLTAPIPAATITTTPAGDGLFVHEVPGRDVQAPATGTVSKVWQDDKLGLSAQIALPNGYTATFNGLGAVNYKEGQKITQGQALGQTGAHDNGQGGVMYSMSDPDGRPIDPRQASSSPFDPANFYKPEDEAKAVAWVNANVADPTMRRMAEEQVYYLANKNRGVENQQHSEAVKQATDYWFQHGTLSGLPADVAGQLTPTDLDSFNQQAKAKNDVNLQAAWLEHPEQMTVDAVRQAHAQGRLTDAGYLSALRTATEIQNNPGKQLAVSLDDEQVKASLMNNQLPQLAEPETLKSPAEKTAAKEQQVLLFSHIRDVIDAEQTQTGRPLTRDRKQQIIDGAIMDQIHIGKPGAADGSAGGNQFAWQVQPQQMSNAYVTLRNGQRVNPSYIPQGVLRDIVTELNSHGLPATQYNIANRWDQLGRPLK